MSLVQLQTLPSIMVVPSWLHCPPSHHRILRYPPSFCSSILIRPRLRISVNRFLLKVAPSYMILHPHIITLVWQFKVIWVGPTSSQSCPLFLLSFSPLPPLMVHQVTLNSWNWPHGTLHKHTMIYSTVPATLTHTIHNNASTHIQTQKTFNTFPSITQHSFTKIDTFLVT